MFANYLLLNIINKHCFNIQIDLLDVKIIDNSFRYIVHARDHFTKFSWAEPLKSKKANGIALFLHKLFCYWGTPAFLQSDNGREFVNKVVQKYIELWKGIVFLHGRPRHPQSQGMVENANGQLHNKLQKWMTETNRTDWTFALDLIIMQMNNHVNRTTKYSPYELVFGQQQKANLQIINDLYEAGITSEENVGDTIEVEYATTGKFYKILLFINY